MKALTKISFPLVLSIIALSLVLGCSKEDNDDSGNPANPNIPVLTTKEITDITHNSAKSGGVISDDKGYTVTARGVVWSTSPDPTINDNKTSDGLGIGGYTSVIEGLSGDSDYFIRAYASNEKGTGYGSTYAFSTGPVTFPSVSIFDVINITESSAVSGGHVLDDGGSPVIARGVTWSSHTIPTFEQSDGFTVDGDGLGEFESAITSLEPGRNYRIRAYAINTAGTAYSDVLSFDTPGGYIPLFLVTANTSSGTDIDFAITCATDDVEIIKVEVKYPGGLGNDIFQGPLQMIRDQPYDLPSPFPLLSGTWTFIMTGIIKSGHYTGYSFVSTRGFNVDPK